MRDSKTKEEAEMRARRALAISDPLPELLPVRPGEVLTLHRKNKETDAQVIANAALSPICTGATTARKFSNSFTGEFGPNQGLEAVLAEVRLVQGGDMSGMEAMLVAQSLALNSVFSDMAGRAAGAIGKDIRRAEVFMRMALKAQQQCRATVETLADVKNPRSATFVKQQNNANHQQVNNGAGPPMKDIRTEESDKLCMTNKLLEQQHGERLDTRAAGTASGINPDMATVEAVHRPQN